MTRADMRSRASKTPARRSRGRGWSTVSCSPAARPSGNFLDRINTIYRMGDCAVIAMAVLFLSPLTLRAEPVPEPWQRAIGAWAWVFPRDHGAHPAFKTEWWYVT